jgi:hypothetical protein
MMTTGEIPTIVGASEVIPLALAHGAESLVPGLGPAMLAALCAAALGCAAALLRAMARALTAAAELHPRGQGVPRWAFDAGALAAAALLCAGGDGIVETMVAANVVYLASIGPLLASMLTGTRIGTAAAACSAAVGLAVAVAVEGMARFAPVAGGPHLAALVGGAACAMLALRGRGVARRAAVAACATSRTGP